MRKKYSEAWSSGIISTGGDLWTEILLGMGWLFLKKIIMYVTERNRSLGHALPVQEQSFIFWYFHIKLLQRRTTSHAASYDSEESLTHRVVRQNQDRS
jgi:hypothetical protein